jgi:serine/threonine protein kinase
VNCPRCQTSVTEEQKICANCGEALPGTFPIPRELPTLQDPMIGRLLAEKYKVIKKIGAGGFGSVYEAQHTRLDSKVAIKTLHSEALRQNLVVERFKREALATSRLKSPYVVKVFDRGGTDDGTLWLAMEFIEGQSLDAVLQQRKKLTEAETLSILLPICEGLAEAHEKGIIHRDLKPQNIMLMPVSNQAFSPKILDFGIAGLQEAGSADLTGTGMVSGTPKYMAPEQWEGLKNTDARSDIYALGLIAYQCLAGALPFFAEAPLAWMKLHCFATPKPLQEAIGGPVSPAMEGAIMAAIAKEPSDRPQSITEFRQLLEGIQKVPLWSKPSVPVLILGDAPTADLPGPTASGTDPTREHLPLTNPPSTQPKKINPRTWALGLGLVILSAAGFGVWRLPLSTPPKEIPPASTMVSPKSLPSSAPKTQIASAPVAPTTISQPTPRSPKSEACLQAKDIDDAFSACQIASKEPNVDPETLAKIEKSKKSFFEKYSTVITEAISKKETNLSNAQKALEKLALLKDNPEVEIFRRQLAELSKQNLWAKIEQQVNGRQLKEACTSLKKYFALKLSKTELDQALKLRDKEFADAPSFEECQN